MIDSPKYSVIIPIYNAEKTLPRCLDSLLNQARDDVQFILVDDGSKDGSETICREYANRHPGITVVSKLNGGVSSARNVGLDLACGSYVLFVDSDDYVSDDYFTVLDQLEREGDFDLIIFSNFRTDGTHSTPRLLSNTASYDPDTVMELLSQSYYQKTINPPWNKCYRLEMIRRLGLRFREELSIGEDKLYNLEYAIHCDSCRFSSAALYYVSTEEAYSLSRKPRTDLVEQFEKLDSAIRTILNDTDIALERRLPFQTADNIVRYRSVYAHTKRMHRSGVSRRDRIREIRRMCDELNRERLRVPHSVFCMMIFTPVRFRLAWLIDLLALRLAR